MVPAHPGQPGAAVVSNLRAPATSFIGRPREISELLGHRRAITRKWPRCRGPEQDFRAP